MEEIKNPVEYLGVKMSKDNLIDFHKDFEVKRWDDSLQLISKKTYEQGEDTEPFNNIKYRYVIIGEGSDCGLTTIDENGEEVEADLYSAYLVPCVEYIDDSKVLDVAELYGMEDVPINELRKEFTEIDFAKEGYGIPLGSVVKKSLTWADEDIWDKETINGFATAIQFIDSMRGFYLDGKVNSFMTGWNWLEMCLTSKKLGDFI